MVAHKVFAYVTTDMIFGGKEILGAPRGVHSFLSVGAWFEVWWNLQGLFIGEVKPQM